MNDNFDQVKEVDYIIVGFGLAGSAFAEVCRKENRSFVVIDKEGQSASKIAAGLYNPVILKRYTLPYLAIQQFDAALSFFKDIEDVLKITVMENLPVRKVFYAVEDQNNWFAASDKLGVDRFVKPSIVKNTSGVINAPFDFGEVQETGRLNIKKLLSSYRKYLEDKGAFAKASFDHSQIQFKDEQIVYKSYKAKHIIFAEGYGVKKNPFFKELPLVGNKGEYIIIHAPDLKLDTVLKSSFFIIPLGKDTYKVGATYNWVDKDWLTTIEAKNELIEKLKGLILVPFEVIDQEVGIRPTTGDRRPLVGLHPRNKQLALLNGLGTRGVMAGPTLAQYLFDYIEHGVPLLPEIDVMRFSKKFV